MDLTELKRIRLEKKIKLKDLAKSIGMNSRNISLIERGKVSNPSWLTVNAVLNVLGYELKILRK